MKTKHPFLSRSGVILFYFGYVHKAGKVFTFMLEKMKIFNKISGAIGRKSKFSFDFASQIY